MPAPGWRKGAMKAAIGDRRYDELAVVDGTIEPAPRTSPIRREDYTPIAADTAAALLPKLAYQALRLAEDDLMFGEGHDRREAMRVIAQLAATCKVLAPESAPPAPELTPEERAARLDASLANPDPELAAALERHGWRRA